MNGWLSKIRMLYPGLFILIESAACKERMYLSSVNFQNFRYQRASQGVARCSGGSVKNLKKFFQQMFLGMLRIDRNKFYSL